MEERLRAQLRPVTSQLEQTQNELAALKAGQAPASAAAAVDPAELAGLKAELAKEKAAREKSDARNRQARAMRLPEPSVRTPETDEAGGRKPDARTSLADEATRHELAAAFRRVYERGADPAPTNDTAPEPAADSGHTPTAEGMAAELAASWLQLQHHSLEPATPAESSPPPAPQAGLADLLEKHVRLLLVDPRAARAGSGGRLMLRMAEDVLPATDLWLSRATGGWRLRIDCARGFPGDHPQACAGAAGALRADAARHTRHRVLGRSRLAALFGRTAALAAPFDHESM